MKKVLFVCTGNTCRSPMAEGLFRRFLEDKGVKGVLVGSAGLAAFTGDEVSENAVKVGLELGVDISAHRAKRLTEYDIDEADLIVCMTAAHYRVLRSLVPEEKLFLPEKDISDPFGGSLDEYRKSVRMITATFDDVLAALQKIRVLPMEQRHLAAVERIEAECFTSPWSELAFAAELEKENSLFFVALFEGRLVGYLAANNIAGEVYITNVAVCEDFRRRGVAAALLRRLIKVSREQGADFVSLEVRQSNDAAIALYCDFGFSKVGERLDFYVKPTEDADIMTLFLKVEGRPSDEDISN